MLQVGSIWFTGDVIIVAHNIMPLFMEL